MVICVQVNVSRIGVNSWSRLADTVLSGLLVPDRDVLRRGESLYASGIGRNSPLQSMIQMGIIDVSGLNIVLCVFEGIARPDYCQGRSQGAQTATHDVWSHQWSLIHKMDRTRKLKQHKRSLEKSFVRADKRDLYPSMPYKTFGASHLGECPSPLLQKSWARNILEVKVLSLSIAPS
jgi:hypothetical protein